MTEEESGSLPPGPEVTKELFARWQEAKRGTKPAENLTNPVWVWLFRSQIGPYQANERFGTGPTFPERPRWAGNRMGQTTTRLSDGREFWIAGEHEDHYDPDFYIYNDVIVRHEDDRVEIYGWPEADFPPTDFHTATAVDDERAIVIVGNLGYAKDRRPGETQVLRLDTRTLAIERIKTTGDGPGWINRHQATLSPDGSSIVVAGGLVDREEGLVENVDEWRLDLRDWRWTRLTERRWPRAVIRRVDGEMLHLFDYWRLQMNVGCPLPDSLPPELQTPDLQAAMEILAKLPTLEEELGAPPDVELFKRLYQPTRAFEPIPSDPEAEEFDTTRILVDGVVVRFKQEMDDVAMTVEGELPQATVEALAEELRTKLSRLENSECEIVWIGG